MKPTILAPSLLYVTIGVAIGGCGTLKFISACSNGDTATVSAMIASDSSIVNSAAFNNPPPLAYAATPSIVDTLVAHGADVNLTFHGLSVLDWIAQGIPGGGATEATVSRLIEYGAHRGDWSNTEAGRAADSAINVRNASIRGGKLNTPSGHPEVTMPFVTKQLANYEAREVSAKASAGGYQPTLWTDTSLRLAREIPDMFKSSPLPLRTPLYWIQDFKFIQHDSSTTVFLTQSQVDRVESVTGERQSLDTTVLHDPTVLIYNLQILKWIDTACRVPKFKTTKGWYDDELERRRMDSLIDARMGDPRYTLPNGGLIIVDSN